MDPIRVITQNCVGCSLCVKSCPYDAIALSGPPGARADRPSAVIDLGKCTLCGACVEACKRYNAIVITRQTFKGQDIAKYSGICVFAEHRRGKLASVVHEIIGAARELQKELSSPVSAILVGAGVKKFTDELLSYGVDEVWMIDNDAIGDFDEDVHAELVSQILMERKPEIFLGGGTVVGRSMLPRVAAKILTGLTADCTELSIAILSSKAEAAITVLADVLQNATFPDTEVALAKRNAADNLRMNESDPSFLASRAMAKAMSPALLR